MPRKYSGPLRPGERSAYVRGSRVNRPKRRRGINSYSKAVKVNLRRGLIKSSNFTPKTMDVELNYHQVIRITANQPNIPQYPLATGFPFRISLNSPCNPAGEILHVHTTGHGTMTYATNASVANNLTGALAETGLTEKYRYFYVKEAYVTVVVQNQINQQGLIETFDNVAMTPPTGSNQATHLAVSPPTLTGELINCAHVTEDNSFNLNPETVHTIREEIAGAIVKESLVFPHNRGQSNTFTYKYTPKKRFNISDVKDNLGLLRFEKDGSIFGTYESHLNMCVGKQLFPSTQLLDSALQTVDIQVKYIITGFERVNDVGSNNPVPSDIHRGDL